MVGRSRKIKGLPLQPFGGITLISSLGASKYRPGNPYEVVTIRQRRLYRDPSAGGIVRT